jgi:CHAT domain-containing protein
METAKADTDIDLIEQENPIPVTCEANSALTLAKTSPDKTQEIAALGSLGEAYRLLGEHARVIARLEEAKAKAETLEQPTYKISILNSLANVLTSRAQLNYHRAQAAQRRQTQNAADTPALTVAKKITDDDQKALDYLQQSLTLAKADPQAQMRILLSKFPIYARQQNQPAITATLQQALPLLGQLPPNRLRVYASIDLARLLVATAPANPESSSPICKNYHSTDRAEMILRQAIATAQQIHDPRAESFALGELGKLYECRRDGLSDALEWTQQAKFAAAQDAKAQDSMYQWEWQTGRILKAQGEVQGAIAAYEQALATLATIRGDILSANRDRQFDFRDTIEPIYRDLIDLRIGLESKQANGNGISYSQKSAHKVIAKSELSESNLNTVLKIADSLQLARLQNYFGSECIITASNIDPTELSKEIDKDQKTVIITSIILEKQTVMILKLPNQAPLKFLVKVSQDDVEQKINAFRRNVEDGTNPAGFDRKEAEELYDLLIQPLRSALQAQPIKTLVFVQDGLLQSIPMAALYDRQRQKYLIEDYAIATTPSLNLTNLTARDRTIVPQILALGVTKSRTVEGQTFTELVNVKGEIDQVTQKFPGSQALLDEDFGRKTLQKMIIQRPFSIIHMATHGQFGADPDDTFLVMGDENKLTIAGLERLLRRVAKNQTPLDLLMLTACQTGVGDDRAILGLTGVAVQSGANSAIGSLWFIDDAATSELVNLFYQNLPLTTKAEALQTAQKALIARTDGYSHPAYWAALVLVGNWR